MGCRLERAADFTPRPEGDSGRRRANGAVGRGTTTDWARVGVRSTPWSIKYSPVRGGGHGPGLTRAGGRRPHSRLSEEAGARSPGGEGGEIKVKHRTSARFCRAGASVGVLTDLGPFPRSRLPVFSNRRHSRPSTELGRGGGSSADRHGRARASSCRALGRLDAPAKQDLRAVPFGNGEDLRGARRRLAAPRAGKWSALSRVVGASGRPRRGRAPGNAASGEIGR